MILFLEHDTPLSTQEINWQAICWCILSGTVNLVRFLPEPEIHPEHKHLMLDDLRIKGINLTKTIQFSARPHIASKTFYNEMLSQFSPEAKTFTEDLMHSVCQREPWGAWKMTVYTPDGNKQRSRHTCGRGDDPKFDDRLVF
jgi:hypothetical protein